MTYDAPIAIHEARVRPEWIDYNGHMNVAYYNLAFDHAVDAFFDKFDIGVDYVRRENKSLFVVEAHVSYLRELVEDDPMRFTLQLLDLDEKRIHFFLRMFHGEDGHLAATSEQLSVHVDLGQRRAAPIPAGVRRKIGAMLAAQKNLPRPSEVGHVIAIRRKPERAA